MNPGFGGGAVWVGSIELTDDFSPAQNIEDRTVAILDRDSHIINLRTCINRETGETAGVTFPMSAVKLVVTTGIMPLPDAGEILCSQNSGEAA